MASLGVFSSERNWNRLGLRGFTSPKQATFSRHYASFRMLVPVQSLACWTDPVPREMTDDEFLRGAEADGHFAFLEDPSEDVYTWDDGEDL